MTSNFLSRLIPSGDDEDSTYEPLGRGQTGTRRGGSGDRAGTALDEENLEARFQDTDLDHLLAEDTESQTTNQSTAFLKGHAERQSTRPKINRPKWMRNAPPQPVAADDDDDVPASLLLDNNRPSHTAKMKGNFGQREPVRPGRLPSPVPGPSTRAARAQWNTTRAQQRLHDDEYRSPSRQPPLSVRPGRAGTAFLDPKEEAMWMWANVHNMDRFMSEVYDYFEGHGIWAILLRSYLNLVRSACIVGTCTLLIFCIDYHKIHSSHSLREIFKPNAIRNIHGLWLLVLWLFIVFWFLQLFHVTSQIPRLRRMEKFYHYLLDIPDSDIQTASWQLVVSRLMALRDANLTTAENVTARDRKAIGAHSKQRMDAHDIANRVMRRENYLIALFNKDILDLTIPIPFLGNVQFFSRTMELALNHCVMDFVFTADGHVRREFLDTKRRKEMIDQLNKRLQQKAMLSILVAPITVIYFVVSFFFRYFSEYRKDPSQLGSRMFTPLAEWKFREFNELRHLFERRRNMAYPYAERYLQQFPKNKTNQLYEFVAFIVGTYIAVLAIGSLVFPEVLLGLEITPGQTVIFWLGILTTIYAVARNSIAGEEIVLDPEFALEQVIHFTHYCPSSWRDRLHTDEVRKEFSKLYQLKIMIFLQELLSMACTPVVLYFSLPKSSARIVDFFREFTIHVDGLGYVCSFAVFDFKKTADNIAKENKAHTKTAEDLRHDYFATKDGKLDASMMGFMHAYGQNPTARGTRGSFFALPPAFPPLAASFAGIDGPGMAPGRESAGKRPHHRAQRSSAAAAMAPQSPMQSILLDPHHQPTLLGGRHHSPRHTAHQSRFRASRQPPPLSHPGEQLDEEPEETAAAGARHDVDDNDNLSDSWLPDESESDAAEDELEAGTRGAGVLGLLHQFQRAQTQGRAPGV
ncbi:autophagy protein Apg9-domain-containing protein [Phyllosticta paracitricarpa]|uniref:Autophagy-related protein 9 n=1 Tax=Phyllosticta paracitricarpa TaxID=2016321 RepID=A0ABR1NKG0_9PEZI